jgi:hypothetical protein
MWRKHTVAALAKARHGCPGPGARVASCCWRGNGAPWPSDLLQDLKLLSCQQLQVGRHLRVAACFDGFRGCKWRTASMHSYPAHWHLDNTVVRIKRNRCPCVSANAARREGGSPHQHNVTTVRMAMRALACGRHCKVPTPAQHRDALRISRTKPCSYEHWPG